MQELKRKRSDFEYENQILAQSISHLNPECKRVQVTVELSFISGVCKKVKEISQTLNPEDKVYLFFSCLNPDCTGSGFSLTSLLWQAISTSKKLEGELSCDGKEDWKYYSHSGCSCMSICKYKIEPIFQ